MRANSHRILGGQCQVRFYSNLQWEAIEMDVERLSREVEKPKIQTVGVYEIGKEQQRKRDVCPLA